jgi:hypothetical protein
MTRNRRDCRVCGAMRALHRANEVAPSAGLRRAPVSRGAGGDGPDKDARFGAHLPNYFRGCNDMVRQW